MSILRFFTTALELFWGGIERYQITTPYNRVLWLVIGSKWHVLMTRADKDSIGIIFDMRISSKTLKIDSDIKKAILN
jgi:hypothetical protein